MRTRPMRIIVALETVAESSEDRYLGMPVIKGLIKARNLQFIKHIFEAPCRQD
jgi:hypothetical protein